MPYPRAQAQQIESWLDAGIQAHHRGEVEQALEAYRRILSIAPEHGPALNLAGTALLQRGEAAQAVPLLERAARRRRDDPHLLANLAQAYLALERYPQACEMFRKASRIAPGAVQFQVGIGAALALQGKLDEAQALLQRLTTRFPQAPLVWFNLGNVLRDRHRYQDALDAYARALALDASMVDARNSAGSVLHSMLRFEEAERAYRACIAAAPEYLLARYNLASVTMDLGRHAEAEAVSREIVARAPAAPAAHQLLGTALAHQARLLEALACYERAARIAPDDARMAQACGTALMEAGRSAAGLRWLAHAAFLDSESVSLRQVTSGALLAHGCLQDGWIEYRHRPAALELHEQHRALQPVRALGEDLTGKHVCLLAEQGLGDQLFFLRYAPLVAARGGRVSCRPARKLYSLLERVPALERVLPQSADLPHADIYVLAGDLPHALGQLAWSALPGAGARAAAAHGLPEFHRQIAVFWPAPAPSLVIAPLQDRLAEMAERLARLGPPPYIGITWRGGTAPQAQQSASLLYKSVAPRALASVLGGLAGTIVVLQREPAAGEIDAFASALGRAAHDLSALNEDLEAMLALLALLDEYIGVSNTNMHLRAAVGRNARVLVPVPAEWRWMQSARRSPWFPDFPIYRQGLQGDWSGALARLACDLRRGPAAPDRAESR